MHGLTPSRGRMRRYARPDPPPARGRGAVGCNTMALRMTEPVIVPRAEHPTSRRDIDPDALKVLYRLQQFNYIAYLVGGSVRDLLLGRKPKDFDIGTDAHPY